MFEWAGKPISRSFKLEIKRAVHTLSSFLGTGYSNLPDDAWVRSLLERAHGVGLLSVYKVGFLGAITGGGGLLLGRDVATGAWSAPCAVGAAGVSIGAQVPSAAAVAVVAVAVVVVAVVVVVVVVAVAVVVVVVVEIEVVALERRWMARSTRLLHLLPSARFLRVVPPYYPLTTPLLPPYYRLTTPLLLPPYCRWAASSTRSCSSSTHERRSRHSWDPRRSLTCMRMHMMHMCMCMSCSCTCAC